MPVRRILLWTLLALAGLLVAVGVTTAATSLTSQRVGLQAEPIDAGDELAPDDDRGRGRGGDDERREPERTATPDEDSSGSGSDDEDDSGRGRGRGRGRGGDDDD